MSVPDFKRLDDCLFCFTPKGLRHIAQGWSFRPTLGNSGQRDINPIEVVPCDLLEWHNPFRVENIGLPLTQGSSETLATLVYVTQPRWGKDRASLTGITQVTVVMAVPDRHRGNRATSNRANEGWSVSAKKNCRTTDGRAGRCSCSLLSRHLPRYHSVS